MPFIFSQRVEILLLFHNYAEILVLLWHIIDFYSSTDTRINFFLFNIFKAVSLYIYSNT